MASSEIRRMVGELNSICFEVNVDEMDLMFSEFTCFLSQLSRNCFLEELRILDSVRRV